MKPFIKHHCLLYVTLTIPTLAAQSQEFNWQDKMIDGYKTVRDAQDVKSCLMGKPSLGRAVDCVATDLKFAPNGVARAAAEQQIACGKAVVEAVTVAAALPGVCVKGALAGGIRGATITASPAGVGPGVVIGCGLPSAALIAAALPDVADCVLATRDLQSEIKKEREKLAETASQANSVLGRARTVESQTDMNCHRAVGGIGPVSFENARSSVDGLVAGTQAYVNVARELATRSSYGNGSSGLGGLREAGDGFSRSGSHGDRGVSDSAGRNDGGHGSGGGGGREVCKDLGGGMKACIQ